MERKIGIIAGSGHLPLFIFKEVEKRGYTGLVVGIKGETDPSLADSIGNLQSFELNQVEDIIHYFKGENISEVLLAGKIDHRRIYSDQVKNSNIFDALSSSEDRSPSSLINLAIGFLSKRGISVLNPEQFLSSLFVGEGILSKAKPSPQVERDIEFGWDKARVLADKDVGQTLVLKDKAVVAVEGMEGTDAAIRRGGQLAGPGSVVIKLSRSQQDPRIDLPAVGVSTLQALVEARSAALCIEANRVAFFQKNEALSLADANGVAVVVRKGG